jgi:hypothetical protein
MKLKFTQKNLKAILTLGFSTGVFFTQPLFAIETPAKNATGITHNPGEEKPAKKKAKKEKAFASLNNSSVKIYPDALKRDMHVVAKNNDGKVIDFFVFDMQGVLVQNYKMKAKDHNLITGLARGTYVYRVFNGDEEAAAGKFEIR